MVHSGLSRPGFGDFGPILAYFGGSGPGFGLIWALFGHISRVLGIDLDLLWRFWAYFGGSGPGFVLIWTILGIFPGF